MNHDKEKSEFHLKQNPHIGLEIGITVGMSFAAPVVRNANASDDERVPWLEPVKVEAVANPKR